MANVVNNIGTNYVLYYNIVNYFKTIMKNHPSIQRVTYGDDFGLDNDEFPQYPLGNILITTARFGEKVIKFQVQLTIADKAKDKNNESVGVYNQQDVPFYGTDDTFDIHANTLSILNDLLAYTDRGVNAFEYTTEPNAVAFKNEMPNGLAGWVCTFELEAFNQANICDTGVVLAGNALEVKGVQTDC
jgi:hypothetical protein